MTGEEALAIHLAAQELLRQQVVALVGNEVELAETLSQDISGLLDRLPAELADLDDDLRTRLIQVARTTAQELATGVAALEALRRQQVEENAKAERDGAALRRYLPISNNAPPHYLDERR
jgi:hypothetical protein